jgi:hypothetical protein
MLYTLSNIPNGFNINDITNECDYLFDKNGDRQ